MRPLTAVALMVIAAGVIVMVSSYLVQPQQLSGGAAGCIVIFFIPICFSGRGDAALAVVLTSAAVLIALTVMFYLFMRSLVRRAAGPLEAP